MIALQFQLTTAQVRMLMAIAYEDFVPESLMLPRHEDPRTGGLGHFVSIVQRLISKDLVEHRNICPAYVATPQGKAIADMIVSECRQYVGLADTHGERHKRLAPLIAERAAADKRRVAR